MQLHAASVKVRIQKQKCLASLKKEKEKAIKLHEQGASKQASKKQKKKKMMKQLHAASRTPSKCQSADATEKLSKLKKRERRKQSSSTSKKLARKKEKKKTMKQLHAASRTRSKCQSADAKEKCLANLKERKRRKQSNK